MKKANTIPIEIRRHEESMGGVFSHADLAHLMGVPFGSTLQARIRSLQRNGYLIKAKRGWYHTPLAKLEILACRLHPDAYLSLTSALVRRAMVGTNPHGQIDLVAKIGRPGILETALGQIRVHVQNPGLHFGFEFLEGLPVAKPEKAFIDCCYFHMRGARFPFHIHADLDWSQIDPAKVKAMLQAYANPKFVSYVLALLKEPEHEA